MNPKNVLAMLSELAVLKYFPANNEAVLVSLARLAGEMCRNEAEVRWLVNRMTGGLYAEWPGPAEMRACFCSKFPPKDGINRYSEVYPEGIPSEKESLNRQIEAPTVKALPPGATVTADSKFEEAVCEAAKRMALPPARRIDDRFSRLLEETLTAPPDRPLMRETPQIITQADIDAARRR